MIKGFSLAIVSLLFLLSAAQNGAYDHYMAVEMSNAAFSSYCPNNKLEGLNCGKNCAAMKGYTFLLQETKSICVLQSASYSTFIKHESKRIVISFRGTSNIVQLVNELALSAGVNFNLCPNVHGAKALLYFNAAYGKVRDGLRSHIQYLKKYRPDYEFYFTGHSLGGALATLASLDLACNGILPKKQIHLWTFGSPRVGDIILANAVIHHVGEHWRITHHKDTVVHVPPCRVNVLGKCSAEGSKIVDAFLGFGAFNYGWHLWPEVHYLPGFLSYRICESSEHEHCANQHILPSTSVADHKGYLGTDSKCE